MGRGPRGGLFGELANGQEEKVQNNDNDFEPERHLGLNFHTYKHKDTFNNNHNLDDYNDYNDNNNDHNNYNEQHNSGANDDDFIASFCRLVGFEQGRTCQTARTM